MFNDEELLESRLVELGLTAERIKPSAVDAKIKSVEFHFFDKTVHTVCLLTLENGFTVTGENACAHPANYNEQIAREISFKNAREKIWELEGYLLKQRLYEAQLDKELQIK